MGENVKTILCLILIPGIPFGITIYEIYILFKHHDKGYSVKSLLWLTVAILCLTAIAGKIILAASIFLVPMILLGIITYEEV